MSSQLEKILLPAFLTIALCFPLTAQIGEIVAEREIKVLQVCASAAAAHQLPSAHGRPHRQSSESHGVRVAGCVRSLSPDFPAESKSCSPQAMTSMGLLHSAYWFSWHIFQGLMNLLYALLFTIFGIAFQFQVHFSLHVCEALDHSPPPCPFRHRTRVVDSSELDGQHHPLHLTSRSEA